MKHAVLSLAVAGTMLCACAEPPADTPDPVATAATGATLLAPFKADLMEALSAGMQEGPAMAIDVCKSKAPAIAEALSVEGVRKALYRMRLNLRKCVKERMEKGLEQV